MRVASSRCSVLDGTVALRSDAPPLWWSATGDLTASRPHVLAHMGHGLRPLLLARVAKNRRCLPPAHRAPAAKTTTSKALLWPVALSDHCSVILFNYLCLELNFGYYYGFVMIIITYRPLYCVFALKLGIPSRKFLAPPLASGSAQLGNRVQYEDSQGSSQASTVHGPTSQFFTTRGNVDISLKLDQVFLHIY